MKYRPQAHGTRLGPFIPVEAPLCFILPCFECRRTKYNRRLSVVHGEPPSATEEQKIKIKIVNKATANTTMDGYYPMYHIFDACA